MSFPGLDTERLSLHLLTPEAAPAMVDFLQGNAAHFAPWDPPHADDYLEPAYWVRAGEQAQDEFVAGKALRLVMSPRKPDAAQTADRIIGTINFTQFARGPFQACFLGYKLAQDCEGSGFMHEALQRAIPYVFDDMAMHRIHANYVPANIRSGRLLARLGFVIEGYAKDYLFINGAWRDHVLTSRTNGRFLVLPA